MTRMKIASKKTYGYRIKVSYTVHCPSTLSIWRNVEHCHKCQWFQGFKNPSEILCNYPYPDKVEFWQRKREKKN